MSISVLEAVLVITIAVTAGTFRGGEVTEMAEKSVIARMWGSHRKEECSRSITGR